MVDRTAGLTARLRDAWDELLPGHPGLGAGLLARWAEPHRRYHDRTHLDEMLAALAALGGTSRPERMAAWFHDAVYEGVAGQDEQRSAELAEHHLTGVLPPAQVAEVVRLVLLTITHAPEPGDDAGARLMDADLAILGAPPQRYLASVRAIRAEYHRFDDEQWRAGRLAVVTAFAETPTLFHTPLGRDRWDAQARANLAAERDRLVAGIAVG